MLYRVLQNRSQYHHLIPDAKCEKVDYGYGNTDTSINLMIKHTVKHYLQAEKIAKVLQKNDLKKTCKAIHDFVYSNFQYKADGQDQLLRSLACAWKQRETGIDCKSYSIIAGSILRCLGVKFYFRKIKQATFNPQNYTHVYVVVPIDQVYGDLKKGYYTIDGTLQQTNEPAFTEQKSYYMDSLPHYGLNGVPQKQNYFNSNTGLKGYFDDDEDGNSDSDTGLNSYFEDIKSVVDFVKDTGIFNNLGLDCIGGTAYNTNMASNSRQSALEYLSDLILKYNQSIAEKNFTNTGKILADFQAKTDVLVKLFQVKKASKKWNSCSSKNFDATIVFLTKLKNVLATALTAHFNKYFPNKSISANYSYTHLGNDDIFDGKNMAFAMTGPVTSASFIVFNPVLNNQETISIPAFAITAELEAALAPNSNSGFNVQQFLQILETAGTVIAVVQGTNSNTNPTNSQDVDSLIDPTKPKTTQSGFGVLGWLLIAGGLGYGFTQMNNKKNKDAK